jgi:uncharacterized protein involved in outer membrane biogenesis
MRRFAILALCLGTLLALVAGGLAFWLESLDIDRFRDPIARQLSNLVGREVRIGRVVRSAGVFRPRIELEDVVVLGDPGEEDALATIQRAAVGLDLRSLLQRVIHLDRIEFEGARVVIGSDAAGNPTWTAPTDLTEPADSTGSFAVEIEEVALADVEIVFRDGKTGNTSHTRLERLHLELEAGGKEASASAAGDFEGTVFDLEGRVDSPPALDGDGGPYRVAVKGRVDTAPIEATGTLQEPAAFEGVDLAVSLEMDRFKLSGAVGEAFPLAPVSVVARLRDPEGALGFEDVVIDIGRPGGDRLRLTGEVRDLTARPEWILAASLELGSVAALGEILELELPELDGLRGSARVHALEGEIDLHDLEVEAGGNGGARVQLRGRVSDLTGLRELDLQARLEAEDLRDLAPSMEEGWRLGPLRATAQLVGAGSRIGFENVDVEVGDQSAVWGRLGGRASILSGAYDIDLKARFGAPGTRDLEPFLGRELPELGAVEGSAQIGAAGQTLRVEHFALRTGRQGRLQIRIEGDSPPPPLGDAIDLRLEVSAPDATQIADLLGRELPSLGPVRATGHLVADAQRVALNDLEVKLGETELFGSLVRSVAEEARSRVAVDLASPLIRFEDLGLGSVRGPAESDTSFWDRPLPLEPLRAQDLELTLRAERTAVRGELLDDLALRLTLEEGLLEIDPLTVGSGRVSGEARLDAREAEAKLQLRLHADEVDLERMASQFTERSPVSGTALVAADLTSRGNSVREILAGLDGDFTLVLRDGEIRDRYMLLLHRNLLRALVFSGRQPDTVVAHCLIADFDLEEGVVEAQTMLLDGDHVLLHGRGTIDLGRKEFDLLLAPKVKSRTLISVTSPVRVTGPFEKPRVRAVKTSLVFDTATAFVGNLVVPGVGVLAPFLRAGTRGADPCGEAVEAFLAPE